MSIRRREAMFRVGGGVIGLALVSPVLAQPQAMDRPDGPKDASSPKPPPPKKPPAVPLEEVREFVGAAHGKLERVREMLAARPAIVNACWDWGDGDFETALNGASHMGRPDIARELLKAGARLDLFAAAMLGYLPVVRAALEIEPAMIDTKGAHGITLITHAEKGGEEAKAVVEYLKSFKRPGGG